VKAFTVVFAVLFSGCSGNSHRFDKIDRTNPSLEDAYDEFLEEAYEKRDPDLLLEYLTDWEDSESPITAAHLNLAPPVVKVAYEVFEAFYDPFRLDRIGELQWGSDLYKGVDFVIVQDTLDVMIRGDDRTSLTLTIQDFRPRIALGNVRVLYLRQNYRDALLYFLGSESYPVGHGGIMNPARARGSSAKRQEFLERCLKVYHGHFAGWHLETHPHVFAIQFPADNLTTATLYWRVVYEGGTSVLKKKDGRWTIVSSEITWIE